MKKKNKKGFTLIELLAVIIILGILMIIAIPSVTLYISSSRKNAYIDTARQVIGGARILVNSGKLEAYDSSATYYIPSSCINLENGSKPVSPYGDFVSAYIVVTYNGNGYDYYWTSVDETGQGIKNLIKYDDLDADLIESGLSISDVKIQSIEGKEHVVVYNANCTSKETIEQNITTTTTTDNITWIYKDLKLKIDVRLDRCSIQGDYKVCYNAAIDVTNIGNLSTIKSFDATFDVPEGTILDNPGFDQSLVKLELNGTKLKVIGNPSQSTWNYLNASHSNFNSGFQIKFPKDKEFILKNGNIQYVELIDGTHEGTSHGGVVGDSNDMYAELPTLKVRLERKSYYTAGGSSYVEDYNVYVTNTSSTDVKDWSFVLVAPPEFKNAYSYNPLMYVKNNNEYTFYPSEYDTTRRTLSPGETAEYDGFLRVETSDTNAVPELK